MNSSKLLVLALALCVNSSINIKQASAQETSVSIQVFYDELSPYGQWIDYPNYGYVWVPNEGPEFVPYSTSGYWVLTDYGWTWVSGYSWGWAPFHYGRWDFDNYYGWFWVPDTEWGPSWVVWRSSPGYYGWSPMEPGISISLSFGNDYHRHSNHWVFVRDVDFDRRNINHYYVHNNEHERIIRNSHVINKTSVDKHRRNSTYIAGPEHTDVQRATGRTINSRAIHNNSNPGERVNNNNLNIYRPQINKENHSERKLAPSHTATYRDKTHEPVRNNSTPQKNEPQRINNNKVNNKPEQNRPEKTEENKRQNQLQKGEKPSEINKQRESKKNITPTNNNKRNKSQKEVKPANNNSKRQPKNNPQEMKDEPTKKRRN